MGSAITGIKFFNTGSAAAMTVGNESNENAIPSNIDINGTNRLRWKCYR